MLGVINNSLHFRRSQLDRCYSAIVRLLWWFFFELDSLWSQSKLEGEWMMTEISFWDKLTHQTPFKPILNLFSNHISNAHSKPTNSLHNNINQNRKTPRVSTITQETAFVTLENPKLLSSEVSEISACWSASCPYEMIYDVSMPPWGRRPLSRPLALAASLWSMFSRLFSLCILIELRRDASRSDAQWNSQKPMHLEAAGVWTKERNQFVVMATPRRPCG